MPDPKQCPIAGCGRGRDDETQMCEAHWEQVPEVLRGIVLHRARTIGVHSHGHMSATCAAIQYVRMLVARLQIIESADLLESAVKHMEHTRFPVQSPCNTALLMRQMAEKLGRLQVEDLNFFVSSEAEADEDNCETVSPD